MLVNFWKHSRNLPNIVRHTKYLYEDTILTPNNVLTVLNEQKGKWSRYQCYEQQQVNLALGIQNALNVTKTSSSQLHDKTLDMVCKINDDIDLISGVHKAHIGRLTCKYSMVSYEWYYYLTKSGKIPSYDILEYDKNHLPKHFEDVRRILQDNNYYVDRDSSGLVVKQSFRGFSDNHPFINKRGLLSHYAILNIHDYDQRSIVPLMTKFGYYATLKILQTLQTEKL